jgi:hypothetical protein
LRYAKCGPTFFEEAFLASKKFLSYTEWQIREEFKLDRVALRDSSERGVPVFSTGLIASKAQVLTGTVNTMLALNSADFENEGKGNRRACMYMTKTRLAFVLAGVRIAMRYSERYPEIVQAPCRKHFGWWKEHSGKLRARSREVHSEYFRRTKRGWWGRARSGFKIVGLEVIKRSGRSIDGHLQNEKAETEYYKLKDQWLLDCGYEPESNE